MKSATSRDLGGVQLRAPSAERRAPSAERRAPSAERRAPSAERRAPSAERRAPSAERRSCVRLAAAVLALAVLAAAALPDRPAEAQTAQTVQPGWQYIPSGVSEGQSFRLLFVTSTKRDATATGISTYNSFVQGRAAANTRLSGFSSEFRALISTSSVDARDNTATTGTGVPIYWLGGAKVADDYADFYDGSWGSYAPKDESGSDLSGNSPWNVWTGSRDTGTKDPGGFAGASFVAWANMPPRTLVGQTPLYATTGRSFATGHLYALSPVMTVGTLKPKVSLSLGTARINESGSGNSTTIKATLSKTVSSATTITLSASPAGKVRFSGTRLTIAANATESGTVRVTAVNNDADAPDARVTISGSVSGTAVTAPDAVTLTVTDDEGTPLPPATVKPAQPNMSGETVHRSGIVEVFWSALNDPTVAKWQVRHRKVGTTSWSSWRDVSGSHAGTTYAVVGGLLNDVQYEFQVRAVNALGAGPASNGVKATPRWPEGTVFRAGRIFKGFHVTPVSGGLIVNWIVLSGDANCGYIVEWRVKDGEWKSENTHSFGAGSSYPRYTITGLNPYTNYEVAVWVKASREGEAHVEIFRTTTARTGAQGQQGPTDRVAPPPPPDPLTATFENAPAEHKGKGKFTVQVAFSEAVAGGAKAAAKTMQVAGGTLARARRAGGAADRWAFDIRPSGPGAVTVTLPATTDCAADGAVCTADGRRLASAVSHTVQGPPTLSVADARGKEGVNATIDFRVSLSRAAAHEVTVRYATRDGTAKKGSDYRKAKGTLTFAAGETAKTVAVEIIDDAHNEDVESFKLVLIKAKGAYIVDGEATGQLVNSDPLQQAWLARFGHRAASDAIAAVTARFETPRDAGSHLTLAGQRLDFSGAALADTVAGLARAFGAEEAPAAADDPFARHGLSHTWNDPASAPGRTMSARELLMGTSFRAVLGQGAGLQWTAWGQGASVSQFSGAVSGLDLSGESATGAMGMDYERGRLLTGFAMTHSLGEGTAHGAGRSYALGSSVTTMLPYARFALTERVSAWGLAGTGSGRLTLDLDGGAPERYGTDLSMTLAAAGVRGDLVTPAEAGGFALALKADAFWVRTESDAVSSPGAGNLAAARADATRLRALLDGSRTFSLARGATLTPSVELGLRQDGGDAETGTGMELGAGVGYSDPSRGLDMALRVHGLAGHAEDGYREWGVSGSLRLEPGGSGRGLTLSFTPSYGVDPGGSERLWMMPDAHALAANEDAVPTSRLDTEVGYGLGGPAGLGVVTPYAALGLSGDDTRTWRTGARWNLAPDVTLGLEGTRSESANDDTEHGLMMRSAIRW